MKAAKRIAPKFKRLALGLGSSLLLSMAIQSNALANGEAYIELKESRILRTVRGGMFNRRLVNIASVDAGTIIALDVEALSRAVESQRLNPNDVNYSFLNSKNENVISTDGFVCGLRVVDVPDIEVRETDLMERSDYCLSLAVVRSSTIMAGNSALLQNALADLKEKNDGKQIMQVAENFARDPISQVAGAVMDPLIEFVAAGSGFSKPLDGALIVRSEFGMRVHPVLRTRRMHKGLDLRAAEGSTVRSALPGTVLALRSERGRKKNGRLGALKGYGHYVIVVHPTKRMQTLYAHLSTFKSTEGEVVSGGTRVALSGKTGIGTGPHLHFETHAGTTPKDPRNYIQNLISQLDLFLDLFMIG